MLEINEENSGLIKFLSLYDGVKENIYYNGEALPTDLLSLVTIEIDYLSDGEASYINLFSTINRFIYTDCHNQKFVTICLDEPDLFLHPEWARCFINNLIIFLKGYQEKRFKLLLSTHSPYIIADTLREDVILVNKNDKNHTSLTESKESTFGANIIDLYKKSFFMESTFGEFAKRKIQDIIAELSDKERESTQERKEEIWETIQMIGENLVRKKLENMYYEYFDIKEEKSELEKLIEEKGLSKDDITKLIDQIKGI